MGRVALCCALASLLIADEAQAGVTQEELTRFMRGITDSLKTCRIFELRAQVNPHAEFAIIQHAKSSPEPLDTYFTGLDEICRAGGSDKPGFDISNYSYSVYGAGSRVRLTSTRSYTLGWVKPRHVKAVLRHDLIVARKNEAALWVTRVKQEAQYRDLDDREQLLKFEDAHPIGPITHIRQFVKSLMRPANSSKGR